MPTAGEYKHEPSGIPCHCFVKRRIYSYYKKSCLRKHPDESSCTHAKSKKVTFNPILRVLSYDNETNTKPRVKDVRSDDLKSKATAFFGFKSPKKKCTFPATKVLSDSNNNTLNNMNGDQVCPICENKRKQSPVSGAGFAGDRSPSPCHFHYTSRKSSDEQPKKHSPSVRSASHYQTPFRGGNSGESLSPSSNQEYENVEALTYFGDSDRGYDMSGNVDLDRLTKFIDRSENSFKPHSAGNVSLTKEEDKLEEYIYEPPRKNDKEYEYIPIKTNRRRSESENLTVTGFDVGSYTTMGIAKHKTDSELSADVVSDVRSRNDGSPQSAPDLQSMITYPYDIKFLNESAKRMATECRTEERNIFVDCTITEGTEIINSARKQNPKIDTTFDDILRMTPIALFWTGCAFLVALIYIFVFPCPNDHEN